jgi:hypothetical protein
MKHIEFSQGFYFFDDLKTSLQGEQISGDKLEFTYNLGSDLKIDIE